MNWYLVSTLSVCAIAAACDIPDVNDVQLAKCMRQCNGIFKVCFEAAEGQYSLHDDPIEYVHEAQDCIYGLTDCSANCVDKAEKALKGEDE